MRKAAVLTFVAALTVAGSAVAAENDGKQAVKQGQEQGAAEAKDPLQFGPLKVGLDAMIRGESITNFSFTDFTYTPGNNDNRLLNRVRPSLAYSPTDYLTARIEGQWYAYYGDTDFDTVRLYQGYVEAGLPSKKAFVKAGRQELVYGSTFMLGADGFYDGLSFDAVKVRLRPVEAVSVDLFAGAYTEDNSGGTEGELYGIYGAYSVSDNLAIDLYGLFDTGGEGLTHDGKHERTYSVGARLIGKPTKNLTLEVEPVFQFGRHIENASHHNIRAFGGHADLVVDTTVGAFPAKGMVSYSFGSGDSDFAEGSFREFHNPNNDTPLIGDMSVIGDHSGVTAIDAGGNEVHASGLHVVTVGGGVDVTEKFNVSLDGHYFRGVKTPSGISKDIGFEANLILTYKVTDQVSLLASANRFFTGDFFKDATGSGKDINYGYLQVQATF